MYRLKSVKNKCSFAYSYNVKHIMFLLRVYECVCVCISNNNNNNSDSYMLSHILPDK